MQPRFVIRPPSILTTPRELAHALGTRTREARAGHPAIWGRDFFCFYPEPRYVNIGQGQSVADYMRLWDFFSGDKYQQRNRLRRQGVPVPRDAMTDRDILHMVVRPLRHHGGSGWRSGTGLVYDPTTHYGSELFPKTHEYRLIYVYGQPVIMLKKLRVGEERLQPDQPWNHGNTTFTTIPKEKWATSNLGSRTVAFDVLAADPIIMASSIVGVDILFNRRNHQYVVCEFNSCPGVTIPENRASIVASIQDR